MTDARELIAALGRAIDVALDPLVPEPASAPSTKEARQRWAALIKQVYEVGPLLCPKCGGEIKLSASSKGISAR